MAWIKLTIRKKKRLKIQYPRMYYRYESLQEVRTKFDNGHIISCFTMKAKEDWVFIAFGDRGSKMNIVGFYMLIC